MASLTSLPGRFRASASEHRPYPGTPDWHRRLVVGRYADQLLDYAPIDLTDVGVEESMRERDELNRSINIQLPEALIDHVRAHIVALTRAQQVRKATAA